MCSPESTPIAPEDWAGKAVVISYSYKDKAGWVLKPRPDKELIIGKSELQFSTDIEMNSNITMTVMGLADYFAPQLLTTADPAGPLPPGTQIPIQEHTYKRIDQIIDEAVASFPNVPVLSSGTSRVRP